VTIPSLLAADPFHHTQGSHPLEAKQIPNFSLTVKQFSLTMQDDNSGHKMAQIMFKTKLPCLCENI